jgi:hypothetical protein
MGEEQLLLSASSISVLSSPAAASAAVLMIVQAIKKTLELLIKKEIDNRVYIILALVASFGVTFGAMFIGNVFSITNSVFAFFNSFVIFGSSTAGFKLIKDKINPDA